MPRMRLTIEYDIDGTVEQEKQEWVDDAVAFADLWYLSQVGEEPDGSITIKFEEVPAVPRG